MRACPCQAGQPHLWPMPRIPGTGILHTFVLLSQNIRGVAFSRCRNLNKLAYLNHHRVRGSDVQESRATAFHIAVPKEPCRTYCSAPFRPMPLHHWPCSLAIGPFPCWKPYCLDSVVCTPSPTCSIQRRTSS